MSAMPSRRGPVALPDLTRRGGGMPVLDLDALWGTGGDPNAYRPEAGCGDTMHPSDAGCHAAALILAPLLARILAG